MPSTFDFCLPTSATSVPDHPVWLHEVKYDGYRLRLERDGDRVRLITRGSYNWADRYPWIVETALKPASAVRHRRRGCGARRRRHRRLQRAAVASARR